MTNHNELSINGIRLWVALGCSTEERTNLQPVDVDVKIDFVRELTGFQTDQIEDVYCYKTLVEHIVEGIQGKSFNLVEFLAMQIFSIVEKFLGKEEATVDVSVSKPNHPVMHVNKGIVFRYTRRIPQKSSSQ